MPSSQWLPLRLRPWTFDGGVFWGDCRPPAEHPQLLVNPGACWSASCCYEAHIPGRQSEPPGALTTLTCGPGATCREGEGTCGSGDHVEGGEEEGGVWPRGHVQGGEGGPTPGTRAAEKAASNPVEAGVLTLQW